MPASMPPRAKVKTITRSTLMPIRIAASWSSDTARMAVPILVRITTRVSTIMVITAASITTSWVLGITRPSRSTVPSISGSDGKDLFCAPNMPRAEYSSTNDRPSVLISGARPRPLRNGR